MTKLKSLFIGVTAAFAIAAATATPARANAEYAWCAFLSTNGGSQSCLFATIDQCRNYVAGAGFCSPNPRASTMAQMPKRNPVR